MKEAHEFHDQKVAEMLQAGCTPKKGVMDA